MLKPYPANRVFIWGVLFLSLFACSCATYKVTQIPPELQHYFMTDYPEYEAAAPPAAWGEDGAQNPKLIQKLLDEYPEEKRKLLIHDPKLDLVAMVYAYAYSSADTTSTDYSLPSEPLTQWMFWKVGIVGVYKDRYASWGRGRNPVNIIDSVFKNVPRQVKVRDKPVHFGIARLKTGTRRYGLAVVSASKDIDIEPLSKHVAPGEKIVIRGKITVPLKKPWLYYETSKGRIKRRKIVPNEDGSFAVHYKAPEKPGRYLLGFYNQNENKLYNSKGVFPLYVGVEEPHGPDPSITHAQGNPKDRKLWAARILQFYNKEREKRGLEKIKLCEAINQLARTTAKNSVEKKKYVEKASLEERLTEAGVTNVKKSYRRRSSYGFVDDHTLASLNDILFKKRILNPDVRYLGVGIVPTNPKRTWFKFVVYAVAADSCPGTIEPVAPPETATQQGE